MSRPEAALGLARAGWHVFPLHHHVGGGRCSCGDKLCVWPHNKTAAKHPRTAHGRNDATSGVAQVMAWWGKWPEANIGLVTGGGMFVVDVDGEQGWEFLKGRGVPETLSVRTGRGMHLYLFAPEGVCVRNRAKLGPELDVRGDGGYVLAPPSGHASGETYEWVDETVPIADAPAWLVDLVREREVPERPASVPVRTDGLEAYVRAALEGEVARVMDAIPGTRNDTLNTAAFALGQLVGAGALPESATEALRDAGLAIGLSERETDLTLRSGLEAGKREPRDIPERPPQKRESPRGQGLSDSSEGDSEGGLTVAEQPLTLPSSNGTRPHVAYPINVWPEQVAEFIEATALSVCVAPEAVGTAVLAVAAGAIGHARWLAVKDDWTERPGIYAGLVAASGERKSPAIRQAAAPLEAIQAEHIAKWKAEKKLWEEAPSKKKPELGGPLMKDVTTEAVAAALMEHPRGVILLRDELVGFVKAMGQYKGGHGDDRQKWLEAWSGGTMLIRRRGSDPIAVEKPCLSVLGGIQPAVFDGLRSEDDGLAERFLYCVMPSVPLRASTPAVSRPVRGTWEAIVRELYKAQAREVECEAAGCLTSARQRVLDERGSMPPSLRAYWGKGEAHLARLAIVLTSVWEACGGSGRLTDDHVGRAEDLLAFYLEQARTLFLGDVVPVRTFEMASPAKEQELVLWLRTRGGSATKREAMRGDGPFKRMNAKETQIVLDGARERGHVGTAEGPRGGLILTILD